MTSQLLLYPWYYAKYLQLCCTKERSWNDMTVVHNDNLILGWTIPLIQALQQNHITTVIYWEHAPRYSSCVKTVEETFLEYFTLSCSTLRFLLRNSTDAQHWRPSAVSHSKRAGGNVIISQRSKYEGQNRGSPASLHTGKLQQEERVSYARAERFGHSTLPRVNRGGAYADKSSIPFFHFTHHFLEPWAQS